MTPEELKAIENRCNKATPGPWYFHPGDSYCAFPSIMTRNKHFLVFDIADDAPTEFPGRDEDADFVAHAREDIPKLLSYIKKLEDQKWIHVIDNPPKENEEVLFGLFDPTTQVFQGYMREGYIFSDSHDERHLPVRGMYWEVLPGLPKNIYKDLEEHEKAYQKEGG